MFKLQLPPGKALFRRAAGRRAEIPAVVNDSTHFSHHNLP
jgi:hypothetical protein